MGTPAQVEEAVRAQKNEGYDLIKFRERPDTTTGLPLVAYKRMIEVANEVQLPLVGHAPGNLGLDAMLHAHQSLAHMNMLSNAHLMPLASHTGTLLISLGSLAGVVAAAMGLALCAGRYRWQQQQPFTLRPLRSTSVLAGAGITAAIIRVRTSRRTRVRKCTPALATHHDCRGYSPGSANALDRSPARVVGHCRRRSRPERGGRWL